MQSVAQMLWSFTELPIIPIPSQNICRSALTRGRVTVYIDGFSIDDWSISFPFLSLTLTCIIFFLSSVIISSIIFIIIITRPKPPYGRQGLAGLWARIQSGGYILGRSQRLTSRLRRSARIG